MLENRLGGGLAGLLTGLAMTLAGVGSLLKAPGQIPMPLAIGICAVLLVVGIQLVISSVLLPRAVVWRRASSGGGYEPLARYVVPPHEALANTCWHCGASVRKRATICGACGATRLMLRDASAPIIPTGRVWTSTAVIPVVEPAEPTEPAGVDSSSFPLYTPDGWDQPVETLPIPAIDLPEAEAPKGEAPETADVASTPDPDEQPTLTLKA